EPAQRVDPRDELRRLLGPWFPAVDRDDVAELALEGAAARELHRHGGVSAQVQQLEARRGAAGEIRLIDDPIQPRGPTSLESRGDLGEMLVHLADDDVIGERKQRLGLAARVGASDDRSGPELAATP